MIVNVLYGVIMYIDYLLYIYIWFFVIKVINICCVEIVFV